MDFESKIEMELYMKAMILKKYEKIENNPLEEIEKDLLEPSFGEVRIKIEECGICHTDLHVIEGELKHKRLPIIPGHQIVGIVDKIGEGVSSIVKGARVGVGWLYNSCGKCEYCLKGKENLCDSPMFTGYDVDGGYAEYAIAKESFAYPIPEDFSNEKAAPLLCAGIIGYRSYKISNVKEGENLGLIGFGASAHIVLQIAKYFHCNIYVFSRSEEHKELAIELGANWVGNLEEEPPIKLDSIIIFAPVGKFYIRALELLKKGGTVVSAGIHMSPIPQFPYELLYFEKSMRSVANSTREDAKELLSLAPKIPIKIKTETFLLKEANIALQLLKQGKINGAAVLHIA